MLRKITKKINAIISSFIPQHVLAQNELLRKAKILVSIHFLIIFIGIVLALTTTFVEGSNPLPAIIGALGCVVALFIFKRWGNFSISGNFIASLPVGVLIFEVAKTGGIYSDNMLWLYTGALLAFLFTDRIWGVLWSIATMSFHIYLYTLALSDPSQYQSSAGIDPTYIFVSYIFLFLFILGMIYVFKSGQDRFIKELRAQRNMLMQQKAEIQFQADTLRKQESKLKKMNEDLSQFASIVSHDLREPLRTIGSFTQLISKKLKECNNHGADEYLYFVSDGVKRMQNMISCVLEDIRNEDKDKRLIRLDDIMPVVINNLSTTIREKNASISYSELPEVMGYSTAYIQLFQNLISNSIKFQKPETLPKIEITTSGLNGSYYIKVSDNGIGIPKEKLHNIFERGNRADIDEAYKGHGIGLATCKDIVHRLGGDINVDSELDKGTVFTIKLPRAA